MDNEFKLCAIWKLSRPTSTLMSSLNPKLSSNLYETTPVASTLPSAVSIATGCASTSMYTGTGPAMNAFLYTIAGLERGILFSMEW